MKIKFFHSFAALALSFSFFTVSLSTSRVQAMPSVSCPVFQSVESVSKTETMTDNQSTIMDQEDPIVDAGTTERTANDWIDRVSNSLQDSKPNRRVQSPLKASPSSVTPIDMDLLTTESSPASRDETVSHADKETVGPRSPSPRLPIVLRAFTATSEISSNNVFFLAEPLTEPLPVWNLKTIRFAGNQKLSRDDQTMSRPATNETSLSATVHPADFDGYQAFDYNGPSTRIARQVITIQPDATQEIIACKNAVRLAAELKTMLLNNIAANNRIAEKYKNQFNLVDLRYLPMVVTRISSAVGNQIKELPWKNMQQNLGRVTAQLTSAPEMRDAWDAALEANQQKIKFIVATKQARQKAASLSQQREARLLRQRTKAARLSRTLDAIARQLQQVARDLDQYASDPERSRRDRIGRTQSPEISR